MKKVLILSLSIFLIPFVANADITPTTNIVTTSYVQGAFDELDSSKQDVLTSTNLVESGSGEFVSGVSASDGTVTVTKSEISIPVGEQGSTRATIWIQ